MNALHSLGTIIVVTLCAGCRTSLPTEITYPTSQIIDPQLKLDAQQCIDHLNQLRRDAEKAGQFSDALTIIGGSVGAGGAITATTFQAINPNSQTSTIAAASIGAVGGLVAIISKLVDEPTLSLNRHAKGRAHWRTAQRDLDPSMSTAGVKYSSVRNDLVDCQNDIE